MQLFVILQQELGQSYIPTGKWLPLRDHNGLVLVFEHDGKAAAHMWGEDCKNQPGHPRGAMRVQALDVPGT